jgi:hypothetical protein
MILMMMMMMGENAVYVNTTHLSVVLYVVVRKRLKEVIYILNRCLFWGWTLTLPNHGVPFVLLVSLNKFL